MDDPPRSARQVTVTRASLVAGGALLAGLLIGLLLPAAVPTLAGLGLGETCTEIQNDYTEIQRDLSMADDDDETGQGADALSDLLERRPDCLSDADRENIEGFDLFLEQHG